MAQQLTKEQAIILTGFTGILCVSFSVFHEDVEKRLGRPVFTHEFGDRPFFEGEIKELYRNDFMTLVYKEEKE